MVRTLLDCQGLAGGITYGAVQAGFSLVGVKTVGGFGTRNLLANRHLVPGLWDVESSELGDWTPRRAVDFVLGCPPCAGFSNLNTSRGASARGPDSAVNLHMRMFASYAAQCNGGDGQRGPQVMAFESVQGAGKQGHDLMLELRDSVRDITGVPYELTHVFMSGASVGAACVRKRYFWVCHRVPFGIESPKPARVAVVKDAIGDLLGLDYETWNEQPIQFAGRSHGAWWLRNNQVLRYDGKVDAHKQGHSPQNTKILSFNGDWWKYDMGWRDGYREFKKLGRPNPPELDGVDIESWMDGFSGPIKTHPNRSGRVISGSGGMDYVHWSENRTLTVRECARIMGYPDAWSWAAAKTPREAFLWLGKGVPVQSAKWLARWVKRSLDGIPGRWEGDYVSKGEKVINITHDYRVVHDPRTGANVNTASRDLVREMARRPA